jgi:hypothetical protein
VVVERSRFLKIKGKKFLGKEGTRSRQDYGGQKEEKIDFHNSVI